MVLTDEGMEKTYRLSFCCHPIPGDDVLGYVDDSNTVMVHKLQCPVATKLKSSYGERILALEWAVHKVVTFPETIEVKGIDKLGVVIEVLHVISEQHSLNIREIHVVADAGIFTGRFVVFVHDTSEIRALCDSLLKIREINSVMRIETMAEK